MCCNAPQVEALVAATLQTFHGVDILVSNAGIVRAADFLDMAEADFDEVVRVNLKGVFLVSLYPACCVPGLTSHAHSAKLLRHWPLMRLSKPLRPVMVSSCSSKASAAPVRTCRGVHVIICDCCVCSAAKQWGGR